MSHGTNFGPETAESSHSVVRSFTEPENGRTSTTTQSTESNLRDLGSTNLSVTSGTNSASEDERTRLLCELESTIGSFRDRKISKTAAIASVIRILGENTYVSITESQKEATFDSYLTEILSIQSNLDNSVENAEPSSIRPQTPSSLEAEGKKGKNKADRDDESSESDDEDERVSKRQKLVESDMPWHVSTESSISTTSHPSCQETSRLLRAFNQDIAKAKFFVKISANSPTGIPSSQWERILKGDAVDLNQIFASLHHVVPDEERTGRLGDTEISFGVSEPKKKIRTAAEWSFAWRRASKAIGFAFPHRREELLDYGDYIESEFAAKLTSSHHKIILYDIALRNEVAAGQRFLLTDFNRFNRLYSAIVLPDGIETHTDYSIGKKSTNTYRSSGRSEICNKFNAGTCKQTNRECNYLHACKNCRKTGHTKPECPDRSK